MEELTGGNMKLDIIGGNAGVENMKLILLVAELLEEI
jgi:hypothetical protein